MKKFALSLLLIVLISGCTIPEGLFPGTGPTKKVQTSDLITVQNLNVIPSSTINADDQFSISFEIKNQDEVVTVNDVKYNLFDTGLCTQKISGDDIEATIGELSPLQAEFKEWTYKAPSNDAIGHLSVKCPMRFMVTYTHTTTSQIDIDVINSDRLTQLQRTGQTPTFTPTLTVGSGPMKIYFDFGASMPIRGSTAESPVYLPVYITVEDKGTGLLGEIASGSLTLTLPTGFSIVEGECPKFNSDGTNNQVIPIIRKASPKIKCSITVPSEDIEQTYYLRAELSYTYNMVQEPSVEIKPTA